MRAGRLTPDIAAFICICYLWISGKSLFPVFSIFIERTTKYMNVGDPWKPQAGYIMLHLLIELPFWQIFVALFRALSQ
jgi:hypothetical protein